MNHFRNNKQFRLAGRGTAIAVAFCLASAVSTGVGSDVPAVAGETVRNLWQGDGLPGEDRAQQLLCSIAEEFGAG